jgi:hypothetical protein
VTKVDDGAHNFLVTPERLSGLEAGYECAVQLEFADRQVVEVRERGKPGTEVIDRDQDARVGEALDDTLGPGQVGHHHSLGDLENQCAGR